MADQIQAKVALDDVLKAHAKAIADDPRVIPTLRIGGTGHRKIDPANRARLEATLARILLRIRAAAEKSFAARAAAGVHAAAPELFVITPLAEGADRLIARAGLTSGMRLGAILPFERTAYEATFDLEEVTHLAIDEFRKLLDAAELPVGYGILTLDGDCSGQGQTRSYRECAAVLSEWSDILIAILELERWDSETGLALRTAIDHGVPAVIIDPRNPDSFHLAMDGEVASEDCTPELLDEIVAKLVAAACDGEMEAEAGASFSAYRAERIATDNPPASDYEGSGPYEAATVAPWWLSWFEGLNGAAVKVVRFPFQRRKLKSRSQRIEAWSLPFDARTAEPFVDLFLRHHRADVAANAYGALHRSGQLVTVLLSITIGVVAIIDAIIPHPARLVSLAFALIELALLGYVAALIVTARRQRWLERWLEYRLIAEVLRSAKFLLVSGRSTLFADAELARAAQSAPQQWTYTYCRDVMRSLRLAMPGRARDAATDARQHVLAYLAAQCVGAQIAYHDKTVHLRANVDATLRWLALGLGGLSFVVVALKLAFESFAPESPLRLVGDFELFLPPLAGALLALRASGEHGIVVRRSKALVAALQLQQQQLAAASSIYRLQQQLSAAIAAQLRDVDGWFELFSDKPLEM